MGALAERWRPDARGGSDRLGRRSPIRILSALVGLLAFLPLFSACSGPQSALDPAGADAERIAKLFWWMAGGASFVWLAVVGTAVYAARVRPEPHTERTANWLIVGGGVLFPTVVLAALLSYGLFLMPRLGPSLGQSAAFVAEGPGGEPAADVLRIEVAGEQWWWRVRYVPPEGGPFELANELHLAVGEPVLLELSSPDVVHSFWVPSLGGKMDMIPGRRTRTVLQPTRTGVFRGACAEYCGTAHALMSFVVVVEEPAEMAAWMERQRRPAIAAGGAVPEVGGTSDGTSSEEGGTSPEVAGTSGGRASAAAHGARLFLANGCGACHAVRGTPADGRVGPDLTHVGSRRTLGAATLGTEAADFRRWLAQTESVKPGVHMPSFGMLENAELDALAAYLESLR